MKGKKGKLASRKIVVLPVQDYVRRVLLAIPASNMKADDEEAAEKQEKPSFKTFEVSFAKDFSQKASIRQLRRWKTIPTPSAFCSEALDNGGRDSMRIVATRRRHVTLEML